METCPNCNLQYKRNNKYNHGLPNIHPTANNKYDCQQYKGIVHLGDKRSHLQSNEHENNKKMWFFETSKKDIYTLNLPILNLQHIENEVVSRINNNFTDKTYTHLNPEFDRVDDLIRKAIDDCEKYFH